MRGAAQGYTFEVPTSIQNPQQQVAPQGPVDPVGAAMTGLQNVSGVTKDYYDKWAKVKSFAHGMWETYGIDVTKPDYSNPASIKANDLYNKALADLQYQGDTLQTSQKMLTRMQNNPNMMQTGAIGQTPFAMQDQRDVFQNTRVPDIVQEYNSKLQDKYYTDADLGQAKGLYDKAVSYIDSRIEADPANRKTYEYWKASLTKPTKSTFIQRSSGSGSGNAQPQYIDMASKLANLALGTDDSYDANTMIDGQIALTTREFSGLSLGEQAATTDDDKVIKDKNGKVQYIDKIIREFNFMLDAGEFIAVYEDGTSEALGDDIKAIGERLIANNPRLGTADKFKQALQRFTDEKGAVKADMFVSQAARQGRDQKVASKMQIKKAIDAARDNLKKQANQGFFGALFTGATEIATPTGTISVDPNLTDNKLEVTKENGTVEDMTPSEAADYLFNSGVTIEEITRAFGLDQVGTETAPTPTEQAPQGSVDDLI